MARRARGEGNLRKRPDGRYEIRITDPVTGKRRSLFARTEEEAVERKNAAHASAVKGEAIADGKTSCGTYFATWIAANTNIRPSTSRRYEQLLRLHATPNIGRVRMRELTPTHLRTMYATLLKAGLHPRTVGHVHRVVHTALEQAVTDGIVGRNVAGLVKPPPVAASQMETLDPAAVRRLIKAAEEHRIGPIFTVAVTTGMREGELLGLRWKDCDLKAGTIRVRRTLANIRGGEPQYQEPKTEASRRVVTLSKTAAEALRAHRPRQVAERLAADFWEDRDLVFPNTIGREMHAGHFLRDVWAPVREVAKLPAGFKFHGLRHTAASLSLAAGVPVATVSAMLGHASPRITMQIYAHAIPGTQQLAADAMDRLVGEGRSRRRG